MIHFQLRDLHLETFGQRTYQWGEYTLTIEIAAWNIRLPNKWLATNNSRRPEIDQTLPLFIGKRVRIARLSYPTSTIEFTSGLTLELGPDTRLYGDWWPARNWCLSHRHKEAIEFKYRSHDLIAE